MTRGGNVVPEAKAIGHGRERLRGGMNVVPETEAESLEELSHDSASFGLL